MFNELERMYDYHANLCKHINRSDSRKELLEEVDYEKIRKYMDVTKKIWLWVLSKRFGDNIPEEQTYFFEVSF